MKTTILMRGPFLTSSGYGVHARQFARWILDREEVWNLDITFQTLNWGTTPWLVDPDAENGLIGKIIERTVTPKPKYDASIQIQLPNEWDPSLSTYNIGITAAVETDRCHPDWVAACNKMSGAIFPSEHARKSITNVGNILTPNFVVPEAYGDAFAKEGTELPELNLDLKSPFNFLMVGQLTGTSAETDRKNVLNCLRWVCETFPGNADVGVVIKTNLGRSTNIDRYQVQKILEQVASEIRTGEFPRFELVHGTMTDDEMAALYRHPKIKALLAPTKGEGFGLPILEAAVSGLPVISTGWSGHTEFLSQGKTISVDYELSEVHKSRIDGRIFVKGARWAKLNEIDFKKKIKKFKESPTTPKEWAKDLQISLRESHSQRAIEKKLDGLFEGVFKK